LARKEAGGGVSRPGEDPARNAGFLAGRGLAPAAFLWEGVRAGGCTPPTKRPPPNRGWQVAVLCRRLRPGCFTDPFAAMNPWGQSGLAASRSPLAPWDLLLQRTASRRPALPGDPVRRGRLRPTSGGTVRLW